MKTDADNSVLEDRLDKLDLEIEKTFGDQDPDETAHHYEKIAHAMITVIALKDMSCTVLNYDDDRYFDNVLFPVGIHELLEVEDMFFAVLGKKRNAWHVIWSSKPYDTVEVDLSGSDHDEPAPRELMH